MEHAACSHLQDAHVHPDVCPGMYSLMPAQSYHNMVMYSLMPAQSHHYKHRRRAVSAPIAPVLATCILFVLINGPNLDVWCTRWAWLLTRRPPAVPGRARCCRAWTPPHTRCARRVQGCVCARVYMGVGWLLG